MSNYHKNPNKSHPSTVIDIPGWGKADIDNKLIPLILELNKVGLRTTECCQGGVNTLADDPNCVYPAYIVFELGSNVTVEIKPIGPNGKQQLLLHWEKNESVELEE